MMNMKQGTKAVVREVIIARAPARRKMSMTDKEVRAQLRVENKRMENKRSMINNKITVRDRMHSNLQQEVVRRP